MKILVIENNLMWSARLRQSVSALGHEAEVTDNLPSSTDAEVAIINLGSSIDPKDAVAKLHGMGVYVIGHAGHKEKELLAYGQEAGCDRLATNSELTFKIGALLEEAAR